MKRTHCWLRLRAHRLGPLRPYVDWGYRALASDCSECGQTVVQRTTWPGPP